MKTTDFLRQHNACSPGARWALSISKEMSDVWEAMIEQGNHAWLLWTATRPGVFPSSTMRKLACRFVRETPLADGRLVWDLLTDERSRHAVETAEAYADGKATDEALNSARSAAYAAYAAYAARDVAGRAAEAAANVAARDAADRATRAAYVAADVAYGSVYAARSARAAHNAAYAAQVKMIAQLGNPFREEMVK